MAIRPRKEENQKDGCEVKCSPSQSISMLASIAWTAPKRLKAVADG